MGLSFEEVLNLPYGTRIQNVKTKEFYIMYNSLVREDKSAELGFTFPLIEKELVKSQFVLI